MILLDVKMGGQIFGFEGHMREQIWSNLSFSSQKVLELIISSSRVFEFNEPVMVKAELKNTSSNPIKIRSHIEIKNGTPNYSFLNPKNRSINVTIESPDGKSKLYSPMMILCEEEEEVITLLPGQRIYENVYLFYGKDGFYFSTPGRYKIQASIPSFTGTLKSNVI